MKPEVSELELMHRILALLGAGAQALMGLLVVFSILVAPPWGVGVLAAAWVATSAWALRKWRTHRFAVPLAFAVMVVFWVAFLNIGDLLFDDFGA